MADTKWNRRASDEDEADAYNQGFVDAREKAVALVDRWSMPGDPAYEIQSLMPDPPEET
jgi:hypothetical protein